MQNLQFHDVFVGACKLIHYFILLLLALQAKHVLQRRLLAHQQVLHLLPHFLSLFLFIVKIAIEETHFIINGL